MRNVVVVRTKDPAHVLKWRKPCESWDLVVLDYSADGDVYFPGAIVVSDASLFRNGEIRLSGGQSLVLRQPDPDIRKYDGIYYSIPDTYDYYLLADDDLELVSGSISRAFELASENDYWLCQPSLTPDSKISYWTTFRFNRFARRDVNFVEVMVPLLSGTAFADCRSMFEKMPIGWGLDVWWSHYAAEKQFKLGMIDEVTFRHAREPGTGDIYLGSANVRVEEAKLFLQKNNLPFIDPRVIGGELTSGRTDARSIALALLCEMNELDVFNDPKARNQLIEMINKVVTG